MVSPICVICKGSKHLCGKPTCELLDSIRARTPKIDITSREIIGSSPPSVFVGRYGYPKVKVGPMLPPTIVPLAGRLDSPEQWYGREIEDVIGLRASLFRTGGEIRVQEASNPGRVLESYQLVAMADRPVDTEVLLKKPIVSRPQELSFDMAPMGPFGEAERTKLTENVHVPRRVDYIASDTDLKSVNGAVDLYENRISPYQIQKLLSMGLLGQGKKRRMVPTRWSITATDDILGKAIISGIKEYGTVDDYSVYTGDFAGNYFHILLAPRPWSYEMMETWLKGAFWAVENTILRDSEGYRGRKDYASNITGAYYAARLSVLEHLKEMRRQATVMVYREITEEYWAPLGVWVIRETVREAMRSPAKRFDTLQKAIDFITSRARVKNWLNSSELLRELATQRTLFDF